MARRIESRQLRAARALLDWSQTLLADRSGLSLPTVKRLEDENQGAGEASLEAAVRAPEAAGVVFLGDGGADEAVVAGVALRGP